MKLEEMSMAMLLDLHNSISDKAAGPKTFATRSKMIARIEQIAAAKDIDLDSFERRRDAEVKKAVTRPSSAPTEQNADAPKPTTKRGHGVGDLARSLLLDAEGFPYATIAEMVNAAIPGSTATDKSVRWYASKMRKEGLSVPERRHIRDDHIWITDPETARQWLRGVSVVTKAPAE